MERWEFDNGGAGNSGTALTRFVSIESLQKKLQDKELFVEFFLSEPDSYVWLISSRQAQLAKLPGRAKIEQKVSEFRKLVSRRPVGREAFREYFGRASELFKLLFGSHEGRILEAERLAIAPDGILYYLPFGSLLWQLPSETRGLLDSSLASKEILYLPSASFFKGIAITKDASFVGSLLVMANSSAGSPRNNFIRANERIPPLPGAEEEGRLIAQLVTSTETLSDMNAKEAAFRDRRLTKYRMIHFAGHAVVDEVDPRKSCLVLQAGDGQDGNLFVDEIQRLRFNAELVTLSACETALGKIVSGEGLLNLARAFLVSGAKNVVVSLWKTEDEASKEFMKAFYSALLKSNSPARALQVARESLLKSDIPAYRHPYFWASFILVSG